MAARTSRSGPRMRASSKRAASTPAIPYTVDENGALTDARAGLRRASASSTTRARRATPTRPSSRRWSSAGKLLARGRLKHQYPHSWRSKKPVIFRNTPQWFIAMDKDIADDGKAKPGDTLRARALHAISGHPLGAAAGREPHHRHDRQPARLGDLAPARLGRADRGVRARERRRLGRNPAGRSGQPAHRRRLRGRKAPTPGTRTARASASSARRANEDWKKVDDISTSGSIPARRTPSCWKTRSISRSSPASSARSTAAPTP